MSDLISRQAAIDAEGLDEQIRCEMCRNPMHTNRGCDGNCKYDEKLYERIMQILGERIKPSPSAEPEHLVKESGDLVKDLVNDCINRQDAIDAIMSEPPDAHYPTWYADILQNLPSAEPEIIHCKNCKHRDSNDCPMYYEEWIEIDEGDGYFDTNNIIHDWTTDEGFCYCAELRGEEK